MSFETNYRKTPVSKRLMTNIRRAFVNKMYSPYILSIPAIVYLFLGSTDFLVLMQKIQNPETLFYVTGTSIVENEFERYTIELFKQKIAFISYGFTMLLFIPLVWKFAKLHLQFISIPLIFLVLLASSIPSDVPVKVFTNIVHLGFGVIVAYLFAYGQRNCTKVVRNTCIMIAVPAVGVALISFGVWLSADVGFDYLATGQRFSGIPGNPNSLGSVCMVAVWVTATIITQTKTSFRVRVLTAILLAVVFTVIILTGSSTSLIVGVILVTFLITNRVLAQFSQRVRLGLTLLSTFAVISVVTYVSAFYTGDSVLGIFTESVGKDVTFTGRTDLWIVALDAISIRPFLGWGYDAHQTVLAIPELSVPHNHYHNGFLDTLVAGGIILWVVLAYNFWQFYRCYREDKSDLALFPLLLPLVFLGLQNISEYSMLRNNNPLWESYFICFYVMIMYSSVGRKSRSRGKSRSRSRSSKRASEPTGGGKRFRFG